MLCCLSTQSIRVREKEPETEESEKKPMCSLPPVWLPLLVYWTLQILFCHSMALLRTHRVARLLQEKTPLLKEIPLLLHRHHHHLPFWGAHLSCLAWHLRLKSVLEMYVSRINVYIHKKAKSETYCTSMHPQSFLHFHLPQILSIWWILSK